MKRVLLILCFWLVGIVSANYPEYPPISPDNVMNLQEVEVLGHGAMTYHIAWSSDSGSFVVGGSHGLYVFESLESEGQFIELGISVYGMLFAGETLFFTDNAMLYAYDLANQQILYSLEGQKPLVVSHDGTLLAYEVDLGIRVLELATGELLYDLSYEDFIAPESETDENVVQHSFPFAQFSPDDSQLIVSQWTAHDNRYGTQYYSRSGIWTLSNQEYESVSVSEQFYGLDAEGDAFSLSEGVFYSGEQGFSLDIPEGERLNTGQWSNYNFALLGNMFAVGLAASSANPGTTGIWDVTTGELLALLPATGRLTFSPDGTKIAIGKQIFTVDSGEELRQFETDTYRLRRIVPDRILNYQADGSLLLLDATTGAEIAILPISYYDWREWAWIPPDGSLFFVHENYRDFIRIDPLTGAEIVRFNINIENFNHILFSSDSHYIYTYDGTSPVILDFATGELVELPEHYNLISPFFHPDGAFLLWNSELNELHFYDMATASVLQAFSTPKPTRAMQFSNDGRYMVLIVDESLYVWSLESRSLIRSYGIGHDLFDISPDSRYLAYVSDENRTTVVQLEDGLLVNSFSEGGYYPCCLSFVSDTVLHLADADGLASYNRDIFTGEEATITASPPEILAQTAELNFYREREGIRIEDNQGQILANINTSAYISYAAMSMDGSRLYLSYYDGRVGIWAVGE